MTAENAEQVADEAGGWFGSAAGNASRAARQLGTLQLLGLPVARYAWTYRDHLGIVEGEKHRAETEGQVDRLEQIFELLDKPARGKTCPAIDGILEEGSEILEEYKGVPAIDAGLVAAAQAVEHYEMARYGTLIAWAEQLGLAEGPDQFTFISD